MNKFEIARLRSQLFLVSGLFVACIIAAIYVATHRELAESYLKERVQPIPPSCQTVLRLLERNQPIASEYAQIPAKDRESLYEFWLVADPEIETVPKQLMDADFKLFAARAERTLVCGSPEQRKRALRFFELAKDRRAIAILEKAKNWSFRRKMLDFDSDISHTIQELNGGTEEARAG